MDIENYPELKDLVLGQGSEERSGAPEPTLLPWLAPFSGPETLEYMCDSAEIYAGNCPLPPWPDLRSAVYRALGPQLQNHTDIVPLLGQFPGLASWLPDSYLHEYPALLKAVGTLYQPAEVLARLAARFSRHTGQLLDARAVIGELASRQQGQLLGFLGAAATGGMQKSILGEMLSLDTLDVESVGAFIRQLQDKEGDLLALHYAETLNGQSAYGSSYGAIQLMHLLPAVGSRTRAGLRDRIRSGFEDMRDGYLPGWYLSLLVSRLVEVGEAELAVEFTETQKDLDGFWLTRLRQMPGRTPDRAELGDVLLAHPGAELLQSRGIGFESLNSAAMVEILNRMIHKWGGAGPPDTAALEPEPYEEAAGSWSYADEGEGDAGEGDDYAGDSAGAEPPAGAPVDRGFETGARANDDTSDVLPRSFESAARESLTEEAGPAADTRRLGVDVFVDNQQLEHALVAGARHTFRASIGHSAKTQASGTIPPVDFGERDKRDLWFALIAGGVSQLKPIELLRDPKAEASASFEIVPQGTAFEATLILLAEDQKTVIQAARFEAGVVSDLAAEAGHAGTFSLAIVAASALEGSATRIDASFVASGNEITMASSGQGLTVSTATARNQIKKFARGLGTAAGNHAAAGAPIDKTLVDAARFGARMAASLGGLDALQDLERIQVISMEANAILPLELIYEGEAPLASATLCDGWRDKLLAGHCDQCNNAMTDTVCPLRFWGMSKVIEHHHLAPGTGTDFEVRPQRVDAGSLIAFPARAVVGASKRVIEAAPFRNTDPFQQVRDAALALGTHEIVVENWNKWQEEIGKARTNLLISMPHQGTDENDVFSDVAALELGGLFESTFSESYVRQSGDDPGPLVFLIGCDVSVDDDEIASFASTFRRYSPVVIATFGNVIAVEAPVVVATLINEIGKVSRSPDNTVGIALRNARRQLLASDLLVGLQLVGHGESGWPIQEEQDAIR